MNPVETIRNNIFSVDSEGLREVIEMVRMRQTQLARQGIQSVVKGDIVEFTDRTGRTVVGTVTKVNRKTVEVLGGMSNGLFRTTYRVPGSMIRKATETA